MRFLVNLWMFSLQKLLSFILENKSTQNFHAVSILRIRWRISMILKTSKQVYDVMFSDIKKYVYSESVFSALYIKIKHKYPKKTSLGQTKGDKKYALISFASSKSSQFYFAIFIWAEAQGSSLQNCVRDFSFLIPFCFY